MTRRQGTRTHAPWRLVIFAAAFDLLAGAGVAAAQTVIVKNAPSGSTVELAWNTATVGSAPANPSGFTTIIVGAANTKPELDALVFVDACGERRRVLIVERGLDVPPPEAGCTRGEIIGLFIVRPISTIVVDVGGPIPTLLLRQGRFNPESGPRSWMPAVVAATRRSKTPSPRRVATSATARDPTPDRRIPWGLATGCCRSWRPRPRT